MPAMEVAKTVRFQLPEHTRSDFPTTYQDTVAIISIAFKQKSLGIDTEFYHLVDCLQSNENKLSKLQLKNLVKGLSLFVTSIDHKVQPLMNAILHIDFLEQDQQFIDTFMHLLQNIVSAQSSYVIPICKTLLEYIITGEKRYPSIPSAVLFEQIHDAISKVLRLIPTGPSCILPILTTLLPHKSDSTQVIVFYVKSLLYIADYATVLQADIVALLIDLVVQIDIDIQVDDIEDCESDIFTMDDVAARSFSDSDSDSIICITSDYKVMLTKLDSIMCLLMNYMKDLKEKEECLYEFYYAILDAFDRIMLPTHKLKYAQFLLFYICSLVPDVFPEDLMGLLITHLLSIQDSNVIRMAAAAYLGSLISRAKYIQIDSVRHCLKLMCSLCVQYVEIHDEGVLKYERHGVLYSTVQAVLYIFCFRWKQIMLVDDKPITGTFPTEMLGFQRVLLSKFSPLKVCSEAIVQEFARITHSLNILYCYPLISNKGEKAISNNNNTELGTVVRLEAYFPFDPLVLPVAKEFVEGAFQEWEGEELDADGLSDSDVHSLSDIHSSFQGMSVDDRVLSFLGHS